MKIQRSVHSGKKIVYQFSIRMGNPSTNSEKLDEQPAFIRKSSTILAKGVGSDIH